MKTISTLLLLAGLPVMSPAQDEQKPDLQRPPAPGGVPEQPVIRRLPPADNRPPAPPQPPGAPGAPESHRPFGGVRRAEERRGVGETKLPQKPTPFLGVISSRVTLPLGAQLGLQEGFGLVVDEVVPDSPAATAGVQRHDVLTMFNDQQLVDSNQLATLIRARGKDAEVSLTILRQGKEQKLTLKVGERLMSERRALPFSEDIRRGIERWEGTLRDTWRPFEDRMKDFQEKMREFQVRFRDWQKNPAAGPAPQPPQLEPPPDEPFGPKRLEILRETRPGGAPEVKVIANRNSRTWNTSQARVFVKDDEGEIEISSENGKRMLTAKNPQGETLFNGPVDSGEQRRALPENIRRKLERLDAQSASTAASATATATQGSDRVEEIPLEKEVQ